MTLSFGRCLSCFMASRASSSFSFSKKPLVRSASSINSLASRSQSPEMLIDSRSQSPVFFESSRPPSKDSWGQLKFSIYHPIPGSPNAPNFKDEMNTLYTFAAAYSVKFPDDKGYLTNNPLTTHPDAAFQMKGKFPYGIEILAWGPADGDRTSIPPVGSMLILRDYHLQQNKFLEDKLDGSSSAKLRELIDHQRNFLEKDLKLDIVHQKMKPLYTEAVEKKSASLDVFCANRVDSNDLAKLDDPIALMVRWQKMSDQLTTSLQAELDLQSQEFIDKLDLQSSKFIVDGCHFQGRVSSDSILESLYSVFPDLDTSINSEAPLLHDFYRNLKTDPQYKQVYKLHLNKFIKDALESTREARYNIDFLRQFHVLGDHCYDLILADCEDDDHFGAAKILEYLLRDDDSKPFHIRPLFENEKSVYDSCAFVERNSNYYPDWDKRVMYARSDTNLRAGQVGNTLTNIKGTELKIQFPDCDIQSGEGSHSARGFNLDSTFDLSNVFTRKTLQPGSYPARLHHFTQETSKALTVIDPEKITLEDFKSQYNINDILNEIKHASEYYKNCISLDTFSETARDIKEFDNSLTRFLQNENDLRLLYNDMLALNRGSRFSTKEFTLFTDLRAISANTLGRLAIPITALYTLDYFADKRPSCITKKSYNSNPFIKTMMEDHRNVLKDFNPEILRLAGMNDTILAETQNKYERCKVYYKTITGNDLDTKSEPELKLYNLQTTLIGDYFLLKRQLLFSENYLDIQEGIKRVYETKLLPQLEQDIYNSGNEMDTKILQAYKNVGHYFEKVSEREISKQEATDNLQVLLHLITILNYPTPVVG